MNNPFRHDSILFAENTTESIDENKNSILIDCDGKETLNTIFQSEEESIYKSSKVLMKNTRRTLQSKKIANSKTTLDISTGFLDDRSNFKSPLVRKKNITNRYIDTPLKTERQSSQILLDSLTLNESKSLEFSLGIENSNCRKSSDIINKKSPFITDSVYESKKPSHLIFETPEILNRILFFTFNHQDPYNLPPIYSKEYNPDSVIYASKLFYSLGISYVQDRLVFKNFRQIQKFNDFYKYKKKQHWLAPKTVIINFGSDGVFKQQTTDNLDLPKTFDELFINCNNITHLEIRSNRFVKNLPVNMKDMNSLKTLKLPGLCNLTTQAFESLINHINVSELVELDLRNCYSISELSLFKILTKTFNLKHLNLNRKVLASANNSDQYFKENFTLSDNILNAIQISKASLETLAISGSKISDYGMWQVIARTPEVRLNLRRLSLNECFELKDGVFKLFDTCALPNLQVLELKKFKNEIDFNKACSALFEFRLNQELRNYKPLTIALDGVINDGVARLQSDYNKNVGSVVLKELITWINSPGE